MRHRSRPIASALASRAAALLLLCALALPALAEDEDDDEDDDVGGIYLELSGGSTRSLDQDATFESSVGTLRGDIDYDAGWQAGGAVGVGLRRLRAEVDVRYRDANVEAVTLQSIMVRTSGEMKVLSGLANLYVDVDLGLPIVPFVGGGVGAARLDFDVFRRPGAFLSDDDATEFAWNVMAGVSFAIAEPLDLFFRYRHFATSEVKVDASVPATGVAGDLEMDFSANEFEMGLRYTF